MEAGLDDAELHERAQALLAAGQLPLAEPAGLWGGSGRGERCDLCMQPVREPEIAFDLAFPGAEGEIELHLHGRCRAAWDLARRRFQKR